MNRIELRVQRGRELDADVVPIFVDGRDLVDLVRPVELPFATAEGHSSIAGGYDGLLPEYWLELPEQYGGDGRAAVLSCKCGEVGCWPLRVRIAIDGQHVVWSDFQQPHRPDWAYKGFGPFVFERGEYEREVARVHALARQADA